MAMRWAVAVRALGLAALFAAVVFPIPRVSAASQADRTVRLPVHVLPTRYGGPERALYPPWVSETIPASLVGKVWAYGIDGLTVLAPSNWSGSGLVTVDGQYRFGIHAGARSKIPGDLTFELATYAGGSVQLSSASFFPWVREPLNPHGARSGIEPKQAFVSVYRASRYLIFFKQRSPSRGMVRNGIAYTNVGTGATGPNEVFVKAQVTLPWDDTDVATAMLNRFLSARYIPPSVGPDLTQSG